MTENPNPVPEWVDGKKINEVLMANLIFRDYLAEKDKVLALANSILASYQEESTEKRSAESLIAAKQRELARLSKKMDNYIEMRAEGDLSRELFRTKCAELEPQMQQLQKEIEMLSQQVQPKPIANYKEKLSVLQYALERYTHIDEGQNVPESVVEAFVVKIVVHPDSFDWYLRFNDDPDKPLHCTLEGKRKQTTKIMVSGEISPAMDNSDTDSCQSDSNQYYLHIFHFAYSPHRNKLGRK